MTFTAANPGLNIMAIEFDDSGNISQGPTITLQGSTTFEPIVTALGVDGMGRVTQFTTVVSPKGNAIYRALIDPSTLSASPSRFIGVRPTGVLAQHYLQASQDMARPMITTEFGKAGAGRSVKAEGIDNQGLWNGASWRIAPRTSGQFRSYYFGGISADGLISWSTAAATLTGDEIYIQPLASNGLPTGDPYVITSTSKNEIIYHADVSNPLPDGSRVVVYGLITNPTVYTLFTQRIDGTTGKRIGKPSMIRTGTYTGYNLFQDLAIAPDASFFAFTNYSTACPTGEILLQRLNSFGGASGQEKTLIACSSPQIRVSIDVMKIN